MHSEDLNDQSSDAVRLVDVLGRRHDLRFDEIFRALSHRVSFLFYAITLLAFFVTDPPGLHDHLPAVLAAPLWLLAFAIYLPVYIGAIYLLARLQRAGLPLPIPTPLIGAIALAPTTGLIEPFAAYLSGGTYQPHVLQKFLIFFVAVQTFEAVFYRFVLPATQRADEDDGASGDTRHLTVAGSKVPVNKVRHIEAQQHFVRIQLSDGSVMYRARLSDIVAQTAPEDGLQPHRSWWVSRDAAPSLMQEGQRYVLRLDDQTKVPVSRARLAEVQSWMQNQPDGSGAGLRPE